MSPKEIQLLENFCQFLERSGYFDNDWWEEKPTAIERFERENL